MQEIAKENIENVKTLYKMGKNVIVKYEQILMCKKLATLIWTPFSKSNHIVLLFTKLCTCKVNGIFLKIDISKG